MRAKLAGLRFRMGDCLGKAGQMLHLGGKTFPRLQLAVCGVPGPQVEDAAALELIEDERMDSPRRFFHHSAMVTGSASAGAASAVCRQLPTAPGPGRPTADGSAEGFIGRPLAP